MFKRPSKKQLLIRRTIIYIVMVLAVLTIVAGSILFILGYRIDSVKGNLEQGGLVQFDSVPNGASVSTDGIILGTNTPTKQTVIAGVHSFEMSKSGYDTWSKKLDVQAGTLEWLDYARLVPTKLQTQSVASYQSVVGEKASPDYKWLIVQEKADTPTFQLVDLRAQQVRSSTITLPTTAYSEAGTEGVTHSFTIDSWDDGGRYVILKHTYGGKSEYIVLDTQDVASSVNISATLGVTLSKIVFSGTSGNVFYGLADDHTIRKLDLSNATISRALASNVNNFSLYDTNIISYVGKDPSNTAHQVAGVYREGDSASHVLRVVNDLTTPLFIATTKYYSDYYVAISEGLKVTVMKGGIPTGNSDTSTLEHFDTFKVTANTTDMSFSENGDHLLVQSGLAFSDYNVEHKRLANATISTSETTTHALQWLDDAYVWAVYDGHLSMREFDGSNVHVLMTMEPGFDATLSQNGKYIYGITKTGDTYHLQRVVMILN